MGTITEIYDYLRLLYARAGDPRCPDHDITLEAQTISQMVDQVMAMPEGTKLMLLAPVVEARKGEHEQLLDKLRSDGFVRARIDGEIIELDSAPELDLRKKHTIEVVVDRFKVREDLLQRLADSFETAINLADGMARIAYMEGEQDDIVFSARFACPVCGYSLTELEPRLFSFNNPAGACPTCDGLGVHQFFDPARVVAQPEVGLASGAIRGWDRRSMYYFQMLTSLSNHYGFDMDKPFYELPKKIQNTVLYGSGDEEIKFTYHNDQGSKHTKLQPFEGVIPNMQRRYRDTESNVVREELTKYMSHQPARTVMAPV